jgi:hypothetical protein
MSASAYTYPVLFRTLYGDVALRSPRLRRCPCRSNSGPATTSPLTALLAGHVAPERLYLETRWASLAPYAAAVRLLADVLPIASGTNAMTLLLAAVRKRVNLAILVGYGVGTNAGAGLGTGLI